MEMNERIQKVLNNSGLSASEFSKRLDIQSIISNVFFFHPDILNIVKTSKILIAVWLLLIIYLWQPDSPFDFWIFCIALIDPSVDETNSSLKKEGLKSPCIDDKKLDFSMYLERE